MSSFNNMGLSDWILRVCEKIKFRSPTAIQELVIPAILAKKSVIANSQTGSGKTAAFCLPILNKLSRDPCSIYACIVAPSLELAMQINQQIAVIGQKIGLRIALLVGGASYNSQFDALQAHPHVVIGTPGRICQLLNKSQSFTSQMSMLKVIVLDEADRLFSETMLPKITQILQIAPIEQIILATATIDQNFQGKKLQSLLKSNVKFVKFSTYSSVLTPDTLEQSYIFTPQQLKPGYLLKIFNDNPGARSIVFMKKCQDCTILSETLKFMGYSVCYLHSFMRHNQRIANLARFRNQETNILITTDLTSRGLDIPNVNIIINYNLPKTVADYIHRVGRTARNGSEGYAISMLTPNQLNIFHHIQENIHTKILKNQISTPSLQVVTNFNRKKREVKIQLNSSGVIDELQKYQQRKTQNRLKNKIQ